MREKPDLLWCLEQIQTFLKPHYSPASNIMGVMAHVINEVSDMIDSQESLKQEFERGYNLLCQVVKQIEGEEVPGTPLLDLQIWFQERMENA